MAALGLQAALLDSACEITRQRFLDHRGRALAEVDLPAVWGGTGPCAAIGHHDLHELLREEIPVRLGITVTALEERGPLVRAVFDDGSTGGYHLVVGADGVRSWVRTAVFAGTTPRFLGMASWRFLVDGLGERSAWTVRLGRGTAFLTIPLGGGRSYCCVAFVQAQTHRRDRTRNLPPAVRNATLRLAGERIFRANYQPLLSEP